MFADRRSPGTFRGCIAAACLAMLAACGGGGSGGSPTGNTPPPTQGTAPDTPANLAATAGDAQVSLTWTASSGATSYNLKRATTSGGPYSQLSSPTSPSYTDSSLTNGTTYYYVVSAVNSSGESANSAQVGATPSAPPATVAPSAPTSVVANSGDGIVNLAWTASSGATSYHVKRGTTNGGPYTQVGAPTSSSYADSAVINSNTYFYVVTAVNSAGESVNSSQVIGGPAPAGSNPPPTTYGTWTNVTPTGVDLVNGACGNYGIETVQADHANPSNLYFQVHCGGIYKSTDYGVTWTGPINTGAHAAETTDCAGGITIWPNSTAAAPTIYEACIRGSGLGFWRSVDGGVNWTQYNVAPSGGRQDFSPPVVDPSDGDHLLMAGHLSNYIVESVDGGQTWTNVTLASGMIASNGPGTGALAFIDTGNPTTTRTTWLWVAEMTGGTVGTWRTDNGGTAPNWVEVDKNEHPLGAFQLYQPDPQGVVYMPGIYSAGGWGIQRSTDYGRTWSHVGSNTSQAVLVGTSKNIYSMFGSASGAGNSNDPSLQVAAQPGNGAWAIPGTPAAMTQGPHYIAVVNDGTHNVLLAATGNGGIWRYVEP